MRLSALRVIRSSLKFDVLQAGSISVFNSAKQALGILTNKPDLPFQWSARECHPQNALLRKRPLGHLGQARKVSDHTRMDAGRKYRHFDQGIAELVFDWRPSCFSRTYNQFPYPSPMRLEENMTD